MNEDIEIFVL